MTASDELIRLANPSRLAMRKSSLTTHIADPPIGEDDLRTDDAAYTSVQEREGVGFSWRQTFGPRLQIASENVADDTVT